MKKAFLLVTILCLIFAGIPAKAEVFFEAWDGLPPRGGNPDNLDEPRIQDMNWATIGPAAETAILPNFSVGPRADTDQFILRCTAYLYIPVTANYTIWVDSDDGSLVKINGETVAINDGWHGLNGGRTLGPVHLTAGIHLIEAQMFEDGGGEALIVEIESEDIGWARGQIPDNFLWASQTAKLDPTVILYPEQAVAVYPAHTSIDVPLAGAVLEWTNPQQASQYKVYFGATPLVNDPNEGDTYLVGTVTGTTADLDALVGPLVNDTTYYWRVDAIAEPNEITGIAYSFDSMRMKPIITGDPQDVFMGPGWDAVMTVEAYSSEGDALSYAWYKEGSETVVGTGATLVVGNIGEAETGNYYCVVSNVWGSTVSGTAMVDIVAYGALQTNGLMAYYPLDDDFDDYSGHGRNARRAHDWTNANIVDDAVVGRGVSLGGTWGHALMAGTWNPSEGTNQLSISHWIKWRGGGDGWQGTIGKRQWWGGSGDGMMWQFELHRDGNGHGAFSRDGSGPGGGFDVPINQWTLVTITYDGSTAITYRNGVENGRGGFTFGSKTDAPIWIGASDGEANNGGGNPFNGLIDEVAIWNRALSPAEVGMLYNSGRGLPLRNYWAPSNLMPDGSEWVDPTAAELTWDLGPYPPRAAVYKVYASQDAGDLDPNDLKVGPVATTTYPNLSATIPAGSIDYNETWHWIVIVEHEGMQEVSHVMSFDTIKTLPVPVTQPTYQIVPEGASATFTFVVTSDTPVTYRWYRQSDGGDVLVGTFEDVDSITLENVAFEDEGYYYCIAENNAGPVTSNTARLWLHQLVAHWPLNVIEAGAEVSTTPDVVGGRDGEVRGGNAVVVPGIADDAISFDGIDDFVYVGPVGISGRMPRTISVWAKSSSETLHTDFINVFGFTSTPSGGNELSFDINANIFGWQEYGLHVHGWERGLVANDTEWQHLAGTYDGTTIRWYANGTLLGAENRVLNTQDHVQMAHRGHDQKYFAGAIDDARIYNYALSPVEIAMLYHDVTQESVCAEYVLGDFNRDCVVDLADFAILAAAWMECNIIPDCR